MSDEKGLPPNDRGRSPGIVLLASLAATAALYLGRDFLVPIALALLLEALFRPGVRGLQRVRVPAPAGAALVVLGLLALLVTAAALLSGPVRDWAARAPQQFAAAEEKLNRLPEPLKRAADAARAAGRAATAPSTSPGADDAPHPAPALAPAGGAALRFFGATARALGGLVEVLVLLLLFLASGDLFFRKLIKVMPRVRDKEAAAGVVEDAQRVVFRYLAVTAVINAAQAAVIVLVMKWLKMPAPLMWGLLTFVLEFVPYLGAAVLVGLLAVVGLATSDGLGHALLAPGSYLVITTLQNNLVSPVAYGRHLKLNAVAVFIGVIFWWFLWGTPGAFLAVPILATVKIVADRTEGLQAVGEFLGD